MSLAKSGPIDIGYDKHAKGVVVRHRRYWIYFLLFLLAVVAYIDRVSISVAARPIAEEFKLSPIAMGYLLSVFFWSYLLCLVPMGMIADRWGARRTIGACIALWSIMAAAGGAVSNVTLLMLSRLGLGVGESAVFPAGNRVLREWSPASERGLVSTIFVAGSYAGPAFGAALLGWIITLIGWRAGFYVAGAVGLTYWLVWVTLYRHPEEAGWIDEAERKKIVSEREGSTVSSIRRQPLSVIGLLQTESMWSLALAHGCAVYSQYLYLTWLPSYLMTERGLTVLSAGIYIVIPYLSAAIFTIVAGLASDHLLDASTASKGQRRNLIAGLKIVSAIILLVPFVESTFAIMLLITISMSAVSASMSLHYALTHDLLINPGNAGKAASIIAFGGNSFGLLAPVVTGYIIAYTGSYNLTFGVAGILLIVGAGLLIIWARKPIDRHAKIIVR
jgi:ACS family glucarate transporter-like MFS transporter